MAEKRVIEYEATSTIENDDWLLLDGVTEGTRKVRPSTVTSDVESEISTIESDIQGLSGDVEAIGEDIAPTYSTSDSYEVGDLCLHDATLYRCIGDTTGAWDSTKWEQVDVGTLLSESGKIDDVQVNGVSVVTDKVASIDLTGMQDEIDSKVADVTIGGESLVDENHVFKMDDFVATADIPAGAISSFDNAMALPLPSLKVGISAVQEGSGDPSPTNIRPIHGWTKADVVDCRKNLFDISKQLDGYIGVDGGIVVDGYSNHSMLIRVNKGSVLSFSGIQTTILPQGANKRIHGYDENGNWVMQLAYTNVVTPATQPTKEYEINNIAIPNDVAFVAISFFGTDSNVQLEISDTATTYEPYNGRTYTTTLKDSQGNPMECYGGELSNENGVQSLENEWVYLTIDSVDEFLQADSSSRRYFSKIIGAYDFVVGGAIVCDSYKTTLINTTTSTVGINVINSSAYNDARINIRPSNVSSYTLESFNAVLAENPIHVIYKLATPQTIPQDNLAISSNEGANNIFADCGDVLEGKYIRNMNTCIADIISRIEALENA